jgi:2-polyprenyl-6-methoxyphenol hydroxylase-like FAD-dependent oxidoreductase
LSERVDAVVVGARCAGSATAIALAAAGRSVVVLDRARFPSDTLSTHLLWPGGLAELQALGLLERVRALGAPPLPIGSSGAAGLELSGRFSPVDGIDHAMCVRRPGLDAALVDGAREAGAEVREQTKVTGVLWSDVGRVNGVRCVGPDGTESFLHAPPVVGADGRRSTVARFVGAGTPVRTSPSGRACFFAYWEDAQPARRDTAAQWREGAELGTAFPCDDGLVLSLLQPPEARAGDFLRHGLEDEYRRGVAAIPGLAARLEGARLATKVRSATGLASYFRSSAGPGWALPGDAGHFKDPVTAQGIRDALRYGRLLGERAAPVLDAEPAVVDATLRAWEREREADCLEVYEWTNGLARGEPPTPLELELQRAAARDPALVTAMLDVFSRTRRPSDVATGRLALRLTARALVRPGADRPAVVRAAWREARVALAR